MRETSQPPRWMTVPELAVRLGMTERWVRRQVENRAIPFTKLGAFVRFDHEQIDEWVEQNSVRPE